MKTEQGAKLGEGREGCCLLRGQERAIREGLEEDLPGGGKGKPRPQGGKNLVRTEGVDEEEELSGVPGAPSLWRAGVLERL